MLAVKLESVAHSSRSQTSAFPNATSRSRASISRTVDARRMQLGSVAVDVRAFSSQRAVRVPGSAGIVHVVVPVIGAMTAVTVDGVHRVVARSALLLSQREPTDCIWYAGAAGLILHIPRAAIQAQAFVAFQTPRRLGNATLVMDIAEPGCAFATALQPLLASTPPPHALSAFDETLGARIVAGLVDRLCLEEFTSVFPVAASVKRAIDHLREDAGAVRSPEQLARLAGVTLPVLRRNFRECVGVTLTRFIQDTRLDWANKRLKGAHESRSIAELADAIGLTGAGVFARSYQRRFGETPSQTRARAFASRR